MKGRERERDKINSADLTQTFKSCMLFRQTTFFVWFNYLNEFQYTNHEKYVVADFIQFRKHLHKFQRFRFFFCETINPFYQNYQISFTDSQIVTKEKCLTELALVIVHCGCLSAFRKRDNDTFTHIYTWNDIDAYKWYFIDTDNLYHVNTQLAQSILSVLFISMNLFWPKCFYRLIRNASYVVRFVFFFS